MKESVSFVIDGSDSYVSAACKFHRMAMQDCIDAALRQLKAGKSISEADINALEAEYEKHQALAVGYASLRK